MKAYYQIICLGNKKNCSHEIIKSLNQRLTELNVNTGLLKIFNASTVNSLSNKSPTVCLYFGNTDKCDFNLVEQLLSKCIYFLPIVSDLELVSNEIPDNLREINCKELKNKNTINEIVNIILEIFELLPQKRKVFISYKRSDSTNVALQLYNFLNTHGFTPFLDSYSIRPALNFQKELMNFMVDCDLIILLDTENFFNSEWTVKEFNQANALSIGIVRIIWPNTKNNNEKDCALFNNIELNYSNFIRKNISKNGKLKVNTINNILNQIEMFRARSIRLRENVLIGEVQKYALSKKINIITEYNYLFRKNSKDTIIIPTIGIPSSNNFDSARKILISSKGIKCIYLLYDNRNILKSWISYLDWVNQYNIPVKTVKVSKLEELGW